MRRIRGENSKIYKSNAGAILHTDKKSLGVIDRINIVPERKSTGCLTEAMVVGHEIIKKVDVVDVLPDTYPGNNIPEGTVWVNKVSKCKNG